MSIFSDYKVGALTDEQYYNACVTMNLQDSYEQEHMYDDKEEGDDEDDYDDDDEEDHMCELRDGYKRWK